MKYTLGLDIGIASVGWAVLNLDRKRIEDLGVRAFPAAENAKDGAPLAQPRRLARGARRRLERKAERLRRAKDLLIRYGVITDQVRDSLFAATAKDLPSPWQLRAEGLDRLLTGEEFARALYHIVKHRGFKSNSKRQGETAEEKKQEKGMLEGVAGNRSLISEKGYATAGQMYDLDPKFRNRKRNSAGSYLNTIDRDSLEAEIIALFTAQRDLGSCYAGPDLERDILEVFRWQKPFATGDAILDKVGFCTFLREAREKRAPKCSYHIERFRLLQDINKLSYTANGHRPVLTPQQRAAIEAEAYKLKTGVKYSKVRTILNLPEEARFTGLEYMRRPAKGQPREFSPKCEEAVAFKMPGYHAIRAACESAGVWETVKTDPDLIDQIAFALTFYKTEDDIANHVVQCGAHGRVVKAALACATFSGVSHISTAAAKRIIPFLEEGDVYSVACERAGFDHSNPEDHARSVKLPLITRDMITNPVVHRALCQARRVVNAVIARYGSPYRIHVEFARDVGRSRDDRRDIKQQQDENTEERKRDVEHFKEFFPGVEPSGTDLLKWRLYREQDGQCAYSQQAIDLDRLLEPGYVEIDHVLPYSRSFDDGRANKVLVLARENQNKANQTPHEAFGSDKRRWEAFEGWVRATFRDHRKRDNLLRENYDAETEKDWKDRHLNDTRYAAREFRSFASDHLVFADAGDGRQTVVCFSGFITSTARRLWGLEKHREENDLHHALDAAVIAALLPHQVQMLTEWAKTGETGQPYLDTETGELIDPIRPRLPQPWTSFRKEIIARLSGDPAQAIEQLGLSTRDGLTLKPVLVSRMVRRRSIGQIHEETIRSTKLLQSKGVSTVRKALTGLDKNTLACLVCEDADPPLYEAIRARMEQFDLDGKKAFAEPLYKPTRDGSVGPAVRTVKVWKSQNTGISVRGGIADNGDMVRTDVFRKDGKYYLVPVYVSHLACGELPNRAVTAGKTESEWPVMDATHEFLFALHPFDLLWMETDKRTGRYYCYRGTHRGDGRLALTSTNGGQSDDDAAMIGARTASVIQKYDIDVLGDYRLAPKEKRSGLEDNSDLETGAAEC